MIIRLIRTQYHISSQSHIKQVHSCINLKHNLENKKQFSNIPVHTCTYSQVLYGSRSAFLFPYTAYLLNEDEFRE